MPEGGLWQIIVLYLRVVIAYWWALLPGLVMPLIDAAQFHRAEEKKIKIPPRVRSTVMLAALMVAQFLAYRNSIQNLSTVIEEKRRESITINSMSATSQNQDSQISALKQRVKDLEQAGQRIVIRALPPALFYKVQTLPPLGDNKRTSVEITSNVPLQQPTFGVTCNGECSCTPATVDDVPTGSATFPTTQKSVCAFQVKDPEMVKAGTPIKFWVLSKNEPQVTAITRVEGAKKAN